MPASLSFSIRNHLTALAGAQLQISQFLRDQSVDAETAYTVRLCVEELGSNIIRYGYPNAGDHRIEIALHVGADATDLVITDDGVPFDPTADRPAAPLPPDSDHAYGGRGLELVRAMAGPLQYARVGGRNRVGVQLVRK